MGITNKDVLKTVLKVPQLEEQLDNTTTQLEEHLANHPQGGGGGLTPEQTTNVNKIPQIESDLDSVKGVIDNHILNHPSFTTREPMVGEIFNINNYGEIIPVTGVSLNISNLSTQTNKEYQFTHHVSPTNATDKTVRWSSSNSLVGTVRDGFFKAVSEGNTTITVTTNDGNKTSSCNVIVAKNQIIIDGLVYWLDGSDKNETSNISIWNNLANSANGDTNLYNFNRADSGWFNGGLKHNDNNSYFKTPIMKEDVKTVDIVFTANDVRLRAGLGGLYWGEPYVQSNLEPHKATMLYFYQNNGKNLTLWNAANAQGEDVDTGVTIVKGIKRHIVLVFISNSLIKVYEDGVFIRDITMTDAFPSLKLGLMSGKFYNHFTTNVNTPIVYHSIRFYSKALSASEILTNYQNSI